MDNLSNDKAVTFIRQLVAEGFYGAVTLKLQNGSVVHVSLEESILPNQLPTQSRRFYEFNKS